MVVLFEILLVGNSFAGNLSDSCRLLPVEGPVPTVVHVSALKSVFLDCHLLKQSGDQWRAIRSLQIGLNQQRALGYLVVDRQTLQTELLRQDCFASCQPASLEGHDRYAEALGRISEVEKKSNPYYVNAGITHVQKQLKGVVLTADLCPSAKSLDREFLMQVEKLGQPAPVSLSVSGNWLRNHRDDLQWIKDEVRAGRLSVTWVDHSYRHPFDTDVAIEETFLRTPGVSLEREILRTEQTLLENGLTPSVFFRFPGLISDASLLRELKRFHLLNLGTDAWLAERQNPKDGSVILVHANGNEPLGLARFQSLVVKKRLPLPLLQLNDAP